MQRDTTLVSVLTRSPSVKATAPASSRKDSSAISRPARPRVSAAMARMFTGVRASARRVTYSSTSGVSMAGSVSGRMTMVVTPPRAAASPAVRKRFLVLRAGFAHLHAHIDNTGGQAFAAAIDRARAVGAGAVAFGDCAILHQKRADFVGPAFGSISLAL